MILAPRRALSTTAVLIALIGSFQPAGAQVPSYFTPLTTPPARVGTCLEIPADSAPGSRRLRGRELAIASTTPGAARREITFFVDSTGRPVGYGENVSTFNGVDGGSGDAVAASLGPDGHWRGMWMHDATKLANGGRGPDGRRMLPPPMELKHSAPRPLSAAEQARVAELAAWVARRCPG